MILYTNAPNSLDVETDVLRRLGPTYSKYKHDEHTVTEFCVIVIVEEVHKDA